MYLFARQCFNKFALGVLLESDITKTSADHSESLKICSTYQNWSVTELLKQTAKWKEVSYYEWKARSKDSTKKLVV